MARSISSLRGQKDSGSRSSSKSSNLEAFSTCDRDSDTSSVNPDSSELQDNSLTYSGSSTDSATVQVDFGHSGEASPPQSPFSRMAEEHQRRPDNDELSSCARKLRDLSALYVDSLHRMPSIDVKQRGSSVDSIRAVWGSPKRHSERFLKFQSSREREEATETRSSNCPNASERYTAQSSTRSPNAGPA